MKSVKEENGVSGEAAILDRRAKEDLSEEVTFVQARKQTTQRPGGESIPGRRKSKAPEARLCSPNLGNSKEASVAGVE